MKKILYLLLALVIILAIVYMAGPVVTFNKIEAPESAFRLDDLSKLDSIIASKEALVKDLKPDNEARVVWYDSVGVKTNVSILYLHGFSASHEEGAPIHTEVAKRYGANLYLARLYDHGRSDSMTFHNLDPQDLVNSANEAVDIANALGDTLIVISCSTGGTLSAYLSTTRDDIDALIMYSPNINIYDEKSELLLRPWGRQIAEIVFDGIYNEIQYNDDAKKYWNDAYHIDGTFAVRHLIDETMTNEIFKKIEIPVFMGYYYKDDLNSDHVVSVPSMIEFYNALSTPDRLKMKKSYSNVGRHVISSWVFSQDLKSVRDDTYYFIDNILKINSLN